MRAVVQRVRHGAVSVADPAGGREELGRIDAGLVILVGVRDGDGDEEARWLAGKVANLRIFEDDAGKFNRSLLDVDGAALVVSQFTLYGDARRGRRPSFTEAAAPEVAAPLIDRFCEYLRREGVSRVETGRFQAHMLVEIHNDGPVTILLDSDVSRRGNPK
ncbi:MAG TPA: D-tyrosyl-tRNA(Tyr) deacylase [Chloroflexi bacterium]|jgi:D-tyrosyl-tRNA(Tyr) deacylase|nr:D-tyrosyl-tRNA(Tyr) deacylase [Chloroflexota bacterium]